MSDEKTGKVDDKELSKAIGEAAAATPYGTARVADSYGANPHEHKPSQDAFQPDGDQDTEAAQAETGGRGVEYGWDGSNYSTSPSSDESSPEKTRSDDSSPAPSAESRTGRAPKGSSTARSTGTGPKAK